VYHHIVLQQPLTLLNFQNMLLYFENMLFNFRNMLIYFQNRLLHHQALVSRRIRVHNFNEVLAQRVRLLCERNDVTKHQSSQARALITEDDVISLAIIRTRRRLTTNQSG
jgi:hypothetical protein